MEDCLLTKYTNVRRRLALHLRDDGNPGQKGSVKTLTKGYERNGQDNNGHGQMGASKRDAYKLVDESKRHLPAIRKVIPRL